MPRNYLVMGLNLDQFSVIVAQFDDMHAQGSASVVKSSSWQKSQRQRSTILE